MKNERLFKMIIENLDHFNNQDVCVVYTNEKGEIERWQFGTEHDLYIGEKNLQVVAIYMDDERYDLVDKYGVSYLMLFFDISGQPIALFRAE